MNSKAVRENSNFPPPPFKNRDWWWLGPSCRLILLELFSGTLTYMHSVLYSMTASGGKGEKVGIRCLVGAFARWI